MRPVEIIRKRDRGFLAPHDKFVSSAQNGCRWHVDYRVRHPTLPLVQRLSAGARGLRSGAALSTRPTPSNQQGVSLVFSRKNCLIETMMLVHKHY